jgi:hypothetical protein
MVTNGNAVLARERFEIQTEPVSRVEIEVSPLCVHRNGLSGTITFRCPPDKGLEEILPIVIGMLKNRFAIVKETRGHGPREREAASDAAKGGDSATRVAAIENGRDRNLPSARSA